MSTSLLWLILLGSSFQPAGQAPSSPEEVIQRALDSGIIEGHLVKMAGPMGDAAAVAVTRVVGERSLRADEIQTLLDILAESFAAPRLIASPSDREPRTTLFVLRYLSESTTDPALRARVMETRRYIISHCDKYKANP